MKFIVLGPLNAVKYGNVFPLFMQESAGEFDVLGMTGRKNRYGLTTKIYGPGDGDGWNDRNLHSVVLQPDGSFVHTYHRVFIRRRPHFDVLGCSDVASTIPDARPQGEEWIARYREQGGTGHYTASMRTIGVTGAKSRVVYGRVLIQRRKEHGMDCLVIASKSTVTYKDVFPFIRDRRLRLGARPMGVDMLFGLEPEDEAAAEASGGGTAYKRKDGRWLGRAACCWLTNLRHDARRCLPPLKTMAENLATNKRLRKHLLERYGRLEYPRYDNYAAIEVPFVDAIPSDYDGVMGVPVTFLDKWDPDGGEHGMLGHELVGARKGLDGADLRVGADTPYYRLLIRPAREIRP